ncbi:MULTISPECIES: hypothetical protein [unclassified Caballeronia]|uniref:hypothetical protein n=1 Tax=unclassified Caballeronia TaxID=2646786 RepID=UPI0020296067|nr:MULTISPECIES: hypothetical protein [unclassified Caballeronia]
MKHLRVLTGVHVGAQAELGAGPNRIGASEHADIRLTDWDGSPYILELDASGAITAFAEDNGLSLQPQRLVDFEPRKFGPIVLCVGPATDGWPADVDLLAKLWAAPPSPVNGVTSRRAPSRVLVAGLLAVIGVMAGAVSLLSTQSTQASTIPTPTFSAQALAQELQALGLRNLRVTSAPDRLIIEGLVNTAQDEQTVRAVLRHHSNANITSTYSTSEAIVEVLQEMVALPGARVTYDGDGVFSVRGTVSNMPLLREKVAHAQMDLSRNVSKIEIRATEAVSTGPALSTILSTGGFKYIQNSSGAKQIVSSY